MLLQVIYECLPIRKEDIPSNLNITSFGSVGVGFVTLLQTGFTELVKHLKSLPIHTYVYLFLWLLGGGLFYYWDFMSLYFILTGFLLIFTNLGERKAGELSAYSVFNEGFQELMGTFNANQVDDQLRHRGARMVRGRGGGNVDEDNDDEDNLSDLLDGESDPEDNASTPEDTITSSQSRLSYEERLVKRQEILRKRFVS